MKLDKFIKQSLLDIRNGIREANEEIAKINGKILGQNIEAHFQMGPYQDESGRICFDIAVTAEESTNGDTSAGIQVLGMITGFSSRIGFKNKNERISRITFYLKPSKYTG